MNKSHVGLGYQLCPICYEKHDEVVLLDRRLKDSLEHDNLMGFPLCPKHEAMKAEYLALVECSNEQVDGNLKPKDAKPTGQIAHVKRESAKRIFNIALPDDLAFVYCEVGVIEKLKSMQGPE